jgi:endo-1,4-beta-xylanase
MSNSLEGFYLEKFTNLFFKILSFFMPLVLALSGTSPAELDYSDKLGNEEYTGLYEVYEDYFPIGSAIGPDTLDDPAAVEFILKNYNSLTFENAIKQPVIAPSEGVWDFSGADKIADFAREHGLKLRGHTLLWGDEAANNWMLYDANGNTVSKELFYERLREHMRVIITRYDDVVDDWDVVNEACYWDATRQFKDNAIYRLCGAEYLEKAFAFASEFVGENDKLILNETKVTGNKAKEDNLYKTVKTLLEKGVRIDGVGFQCHVDTLTFSETPKSLDAAIKRFAAMGVKVQITEMDMTVYTFDAQPAYSPLPGWVETFQIKRYKEFFEVFRNNKDVISSVTFWGIDDAHSYLVSKNGREDWGLLFDKNSNPKQSFYAVCDF